jgi:LPS-assembly protein
VALAQEFHKTNLGMHRFLYRPLALAIAAMFCAPAFAEPLGLPKLEVDPQLIAPVPGKRATDSPAPGTATPGATQRGAGAPATPPAPEAPAASREPEPSTEPATESGPTGAQSEGAMPAAAAPVAPAAATTTPAPSAPIAPAASAPAQSREGQPPTQPATGTEEAGAVPARPEAQNEALKPSAAAPAATPTTSSPSAPLAPGASAPAENRAVDLPREPAMEPGETGATATSSGKPRDEAASPSAGAEESPAAGSAPKPRVAPAEKDTAAATPLTATAPGDLPVTLEADQLEGTVESELRARGNAVLTQGERSLAADWILFYPQSQEVFAEGDVVLRRGRDEVRGPALNLNLETSVGRMEAPHYELAINDSRGKADEVLFEGRDQSSARNATFSTCPVNRPDWYAQVGDLQINRSTNVGVAHDATLVFKDVPILYTPWADFPLDGKRKTGLLPPIVGTTSQGGFDLTLPFYWNIAPNRDATIAPRYISRRGLMLNNEFRYLEPQFNGIAKADYLPDDKETGTNRYALLFQHTQLLTPRLGGGLNLQKVSDDNYFRDLSNTVTLTSQAVLPREGYLNYSGDDWLGQMLVQNWQTLQEPGAPVLPPYARLPQLRFTGSKADIAYGLDGTLLAEATNFSHPTLVTGSRYVAYPSLSYRLQSSYAYVQPKAGVQVWRYDIDNRLPGEDTPSRSVPIFSLDSGMFFERDANLFGQQVLQTLEPRAFYTYIPFKDQRLLPVFDTADADFNFTQLFRENRFIGEDRVGDANQLTLALTSRLLDPETADERLRFAVGQVLRFSEERVQLGKPPSTLNRSDLLASVGGRISRAWYLDSLFQWDPEDRNFEKLNVYGRFQPAPGKVLNLGYRYTRDTLEQVDVSAQWPFLSRWQALLRYNYSLLDNRTLDALAGFEYDAGCWSVRFVYQQIATSTQDTSNSFFLQLELTGLGKLGTDPISALRSSIPGFTKLDLYKEPSPGAQ